MTTNSSGSHQTNNIRFMHWITVLARAGLHLAQGRGSTARRIAAIGSASAAVSPALHSAELFVAPTTTQARFSCRPFTARQPVPHLVDGLAVNEPIRAENAFLLHANLLHDRLVPASAFAMLPRAPGSRG